jgi:DNA-binding NarL/FixJ family response regulator
VKFLLVDDHPLMRAALKSTVERLHEAVTTVEVSSPGEARDALAAHERLDAVILEVRLGAGDGFSVLRDLRLSRPQIPVVVFTGSDDGRDLIRAVDGGAMAFVHKRSEAGDVLRALQTVMGGGIFLPEQTMELLKIARVEAAQASEQIATHGHHRQGFDTPGFSVQAPSPQTIARLGLTPRQTDVLMLLLHGKPNKLIARELNLSVETIKDHVAAVLRSLNVSSRTQAVLAVTQLSGNAASAASAARRGLQ